VQARHRPIAHLEERQITARRLRLRDALFGTGGNITRAAEILGVDRRHLSDKCDGRGARRTANEAKLTIGLPKAGSSRPAEREAPLRV
jgi:DNA-binding NtrC family response regulator